MIKQPTRRGLLTSLGALLIAAPTIVRADSLMRIRHIVDPNCPPDSLYLMNADLVGEIAFIARTTFVPRLFAQMYQSSPILQQLVRTNLREQELNRLRS